MKEPGVVFSQIIDFVHLKVKRIYEPKLHFFIQNSFGGRVYPQFRSFYFIPISFLIVSPS